MYSGVWTLIYLRWTGNMTAELLEASRMSLVSKEPTTAVNSKSMLTDISLSISPLNLPSVFDH